MSSPSGDFCRDLEIVPTTATQGSVWILSIWSERLELDFAALGVIRHCTPLECGAVGALCAIDIALFQSADI